MFNLFRKYTIRVYYQDDSVKDYHVISYKKALKKKNKLKIKNKNCDIIIYVYPISMFKCDE